MLTVISDFVAASDLNDREAPRPTLKSQRIFLNLKEYF